MFTRAELLAAIRSTSTPLISRITISFPATATTASVNSTVKLPVGEIVALLLGDKLSTVGAKVSTVMCSAAVVPEPRLPARSVYLSAAILILAMACVLAVGIKVAV